MGGKSKRVTTGFRYKMGLHFGICHGPVDAFGEIRAGERTAWAGFESASTSITIDAPGLFGGDKREGGIAGVADIMMGEPTQLPNSYLASKITGLMPAFRGILGLVFRGGQIGSNNPYVKPWAFKVTRILSGWGDYGTAPVTEIATDYLAPWLLASDPRDPNGSYVYRYTNADPWSSSFSDAQADYLAGNPLKTSANFTYLLGHSIGSLKLYSVYAEDNTDKFELRLHYNRVLPDHTPTINGNNYVGNTMDDQNPLFCDAFARFGLEVSGGRVWWSSLDLSGNSYANASGMFRLLPGASSGDSDENGANNCVNYPPSGGFFPIGRVIYDALIKIKRVPQAPPVPGSEFPDWPPDPTNYTWDESGPTIYSKAPWIYTAGSYRALALISDEDYVFNTVAQDPIGPILAVGDPNDTMAFWTDAYNAAVTAGTTDAGHTYNALGAGGANTYPRNVDHAYTRTYNAVVPAEPWQPDLAQIGADMNPAHIIYQCLTNDQWGMAYPSSIIDETAFLAAAQALSVEEFGMSLMWNQQSKIGDFIQIVLDHIGGVLYADPKTGKFVLKLIRDDYDPDDLEIFDESNIVELSTFQRAGYGETVNEVTVVYTDATTDKDTSITVQDLANIQAQGSVVSQTKQYPGIRISTLAARVGERDLLAGSLPLAKVQMKVNRSGWSKVTGDVIKVSWAKLGLVQVICRVLAVNYGTLTEGTLTVDVAEDVFGLPDSSYAEQEPAGWEEPGTLASDVDPADVLEAPYWDVSRALSAADLDYTDADAAYVLTLGARGTPLEYNYRILARIPPAEYEEVGIADFAPVAVLDADIEGSATTLAYVDGERLDEVVIGTRAMIGTGRDAEFVIVVSIDTGAQTIEVSRGILDTTPRSHAAGSRIWFVEESMVFDATERATGESLNYKLTAIAPAGESDIDDATELSIEPDQRFYRPYAPGNLAINGEGFPTEFSVPLSVTWSHRDRVLQTAGYIEQDEGDIGPEPGTTYNGYLYDDETDALLVSETSIANPWEPAISGVYTVRLEIASERDGIESWQRQVRVFDYVATARATETGERRTTESGENRATEQP